MPRLFDKIKSLTVSAYIFYCESSNKIYMYGNLNLLVPSSLNPVLITRYDRRSKLSSVN